MIHHKSCTRKRKGLIFCKINYAKIGFFGSPKQLRLKLRNGDQCAGTRVQLLYVGVILSTN